jgi:hypothetical protein
VGHLHDPVEKRLRVERLRADIERALDGFVAPPGSPRIAVYPLDDALVDFEDRIFYEMSTMLPEERGTFLLVRHVLERILGVESPDDADAFFVPLYFPAYETQQVMLRDAMLGLEYIDSGKKHLLCSPWDTYPRPWRRRANPYCVVGTGRIGREGWFDAQADWFDDRFVLLTTESTIDLHPNDIGILPIVLSGPEPLAHRPLLYSFCGVLCYELLRDEHIRGVNNRGVWERLRRLDSDDVFIGDLDDAKARFGSGVDYRDLPAMSRFTLCPAGWARWSFRLTESIAAASIPVVLSDYYCLPFAPSVPWDRVALRLPERALTRIDPILRGLTPSRVSALSGAGGLQQARLDYQSMASWIIDAVARRVKAPD